MIPKTILQTSKHPYPAYVRDMWQERIDRSWTINWFDDAMIHKFFADNPMPEFPNISAVFDSFSDGGHKADLFRYYYLYLNGGFFIDSDIMSHVMLNDIYSTEHDHVFVFTDSICNRVHHPEIDSPLIFNGFMGCVPGSKIVYEALCDAYNVKPRLLEKQRLYFVYKLYTIAKPYEDEYSIQWFTEHVEHAQSMHSTILDNKNYEILTHYFGGEKIIPATVDLRRYKINIGAGAQKIKGFLTCDHSDIFDPDYMFDLEKDPYPFDDNSVDEVIAHHVLEHMGEGYFHCLKELYRICCNGAIIDIKVPHYRNENQFHDPTHRRTVTAVGLTLFDQEYNRLADSTSSKLGLQYGVNFKLMRQHHTLNGEHPFALSLMTKTENEVADYAHDRVNVYCESQFTLKVIKS
jgi:hypothetical protein